jgi:hypothetical protein
MKNILKRLARPAAKNQAPIIPKMDFSQMVGTGELGVRLLECSFDDGNVSLFELFTISSLVRLKKPRTIFEIGTFNGRTTLNLAANSEPAAEIFTLDLPAKDLQKTSFALDEIEKKYVDKPVSGAKFSNYPEAKKITQLYGDSAKFDFSRFENAVDFVFVDASHAYDYVVSDSKVALKMLRGGKGVILWHDYDRSEWWPGVVKALDELHQSSAEFHKLVHFTGTSLVCLLKS